MSARFGRSCSPPPPSRNDDDCAPPPEAPRSDRALLPPLGWLIVLFSLSNHTFACARFSRRMSSSGVSSKGNLSPSRNSVSTRRSDAGFEASLTLLLLLFGASKLTSFFQASAAATKASTSSARAMVTPWEDSASDRDRAADSGRDSDASQEDEVKRGGGAEVAGTTATVSLVASLCDPVVALAFVSLAGRMG